MKLTDITPAKFLCDSWFACPAVFVNEDSYVIIGKRINADGDISGRVGSDEQVIQISRELLEQAISDFLRARDPA